MEPVTPSVSAPPEPLFHATLEFESESRADAVVSLEGRQGAYIGTSGGRASGPRLSGRIRASFFSANCLYPEIRAGEPVPDAPHVCTVHPGIVIETEDGARIRADGNGYGLRTPERYRVSASLVFATEDPRYDWLTETIGLLEGELDERTGRSSWNVFLPAD